MNVFNAVLTKILIVHTVWFFWDWGFYYKQTGVVVALVFLLISFIKDTCSNTLPRMAYRYSTYVAMTSAFTFFIRWLLGSVLEMSVWDFHDTWGVSLFAATALGIMIGVIESIVAPSLSGVSYALTGEKVNWDDELGISRSQAYSPPAPSSTWRFQCPLCGARVPERQGCWNCGGLIEVPQEPQGPFGPHRPQG